jgi:hypothetical protein
MLQWIHSKHLQEHTHPMEEHHQSPSTPPPQTGPLAAAAAAAGTKPAECSTMCHNKTPLRRPVDIQQHAAQHVPCPVCDYVSAAVQLHTMTWQKHTALPQQVTALSVQLHMQCQCNVSPWCRCHSQTSLQGPAASLLPHTAWYYSPQPTAASQHRIPKGCEPAVHGTP